MSLFSILLEAKDEYVAKALGKKIASVAKIPEEEVLNFIQQKLMPLDPTPNKKYLVWIAKLYADGNLKEEDFYKVPEELAIFNKVQQKLPVKDIMQYNLLPDLSDALNPYREEKAQLSNKELARKERQALFTAGEAELILERPDYVVVTPKTRKAACELGKGTRWCTSGTSYNYFNDYHNQGPLFIIYTQKVKNAPLQAHINRRSGRLELANASDLQISPLHIKEQFPEFAKYLATTYATEVDSVKLLESMSDHSFGRNVAAFLPPNIMRDKLNHVPPAKRRSALLTGLLHSTGRQFGKDPKSFIENFLLAYTDDAKLTEKNIKTIREYFNIDTLASKTKAKVLKITNKNSYIVWAKIFGTEKDVEKLALNIGDDSTTIGTYADFNKTKKETEAPTLFSENFYALSPAWQLKVLVANLTDRVYIFKAGAKTPELYNNIQTTAYHSTPDKPLIGPVRLLVDKMNKIANNDVKEELIKRIDTGIENNKKKLSNTKSASRVLETALYNFFIINNHRKSVPIDKNSATFYFINKIVESTSDKKTTLGSAYKTLKDRLAEKSGTHTQKAKHIEKLNNLFSALANDLDVKGLDFTQLNIDERGQYLSDLRWNVSVGSSGRAPLRIIEVTTGSDGKIPALDAALEKVATGLMYSKYNVPLKYVYALKNNLLLVGPSLSIIANYKNKDNVRIVHTKNVLANVSEKLKTDILRRVDDIYEPFELGKVTAKDFEESKEH